LLSRLIEEEQKMTVRVLYAAVFLLLVVSPANAQHQGVAWQKSYTEAVAKSKETGRLLFADFTSEVN
jgi:hypothetical protein